MRWSAITRLEHGPDHVFLWIGSRQAIIVPKGALEHTVGVHAFMERVLDCRERAAGIRAVIPE